MKFVLRVVWQEAAAGCVADRFKGYRRDSNNSDNNNYYLSQFACGVQSSGSLWREGTLGE